MLRVASSFMVATEKAHRLLAGSTALLAPLVLPRRAAAAAGVAVRLLSAFRRPGDVTTNRATRERTTSVRKRRALGMRRQQHVALRGWLSEQRRALDAARPDYEGAMMSLDATEDALGGRIKFVDRLAQRERRRLRRKQELNPGRERLNRRTEGHMSTRNRFVLLPHRRLEIVAPAPPALGADVLTPYVHGPRPGAHPRDRSAAAVLLRATRLTGGGGDAPAGVRASGSVARQS